MRHVLHFPLRFALRGVPCESSLRCPDRTRSKYCARKVTGAVSATNKDVGCPAYTGSCPLLSRPTLHQLPRYATMLSESFRSIITTPRDACCDSKRFPTHQSALSIKGTVVTNHWNRTDIRRRNRLCDETY